MIQKVIVNSPITIVRAKDNSPTQQPQITQPSLQTILIQKKATPPNKDAETYEKPKVHIEQNREHTSLDIKVEKIRTREIDVKDFIKTDAIVKKEIKLEPKKQAAKFGTRMTRELEKEMYSERINVITEEDLHWREWNEIAKETKEEKKWKKQVELEERKKKALWKTMEDAEEKENIYKELAQKCTKNHSEKVTN
jgi:hypothetical protein